MQIRILSSIADLAPESWNSLLPAAPCPLTEHGYLAALELSGSIARGGMTPCHLTLWAGEELIAAAPCYRSSSERADALVDWTRKIALKHALPYESTLYIGVPFTTPCTPKFLTRTGADRDNCIAQLVGAAKELIGASPSPVIHVYHVPEADLAELEPAGFHRRMVPRYAWTNRYATFESFLEDLKADKRRMIRSERKRFAASGARVRRVVGDALDEDQMDYMWRANAATVAKHGNDFDFYPPEFFLLLAERLRTRVQLFICERGDERLGAALTLASATTVYGRQWGTTYDGNDVPFLYFEAAYYQVLDDAIARGLTTFDPGGPGPQKLARGFHPVGFSFSGTWVGNEDLDEATAALIAKERDWMPQHLRELREKSALAVVSNI